MNTAEDEEEVQLQNFEGEGSGDDNIGEEGDAANENVAEEDVGSSSSSQQKKTFLSSSFNGSARHTLKWVGA